MKHAGNGLVPMLVSQRRPISVAIPILFVLSVVVSVLAQTQSAENQTTPLTGVAAIDAYCKELDSFRKGKHNRARVFSKIIPPDQSGETLSGNWREFKNAKSRESDFTSDHLYDVGDVWMRAGKVVVAEFEFGTAGDWSQVVTYYFRADGGLAKMRSNYGRFMGHIRIVKDKFYDSKGKRLQTRLQCSDLEESGRRKKCSSDASEYDADVYKRVQNLPLYGVLKSRSPK
jgi:hypothetical protein